MSFCGHSMSLQAVAVFYCFCKTTQPDSLKAIRKRAVTPLCVIGHSPKLVQHANSLRAICRRIASTACVPSQAPFSQVSSEWKLEKTGLQGAYPPGPLCAAKISNYPTGISDFFTLIKTHRRKRHIKNFLFKKEREGLSNGKKRKTK